MKVARAYASFLSLSLSRTRETEIVRRHTQAHTCESSVYADASDEDVDVSGDEGIDDDEGEGDEGDVHMGDKMNMMNLDDT